jgi:hypothetical protein
MIRRALLALALLCVAVPARATVLLIREHYRSIAAGGGGADLYNTEAQHAQVKATMQVRGVTLREPARGALTTAGVKAGQYTNPEGAVISSDVVVHTCFSPSITPLNASVYDPRTYGLTAGWPTKPHVWIFYPEAGSGTCNNVNNVDTTGSDHDIANRAWYQTQTAYTTDGLYSWKSRDVALIPSIASGARATGIFRVVVGYRFGPGTHDPNSTNDAGNPHPRNVTDPDTGAVSVNTDSLLLWVRYRSVGDPAPMIYVRPGAGALQDMGLIKMALQIADSASGGKVFENRALTTRKHSLILRRATSTSGDPGSSNLPEGGGIRSRADSSAVSEVTARARQIAALRIKFSLGADPESVGVAANAALLAIFMDNCPLARVCLEPYAGTYTNSTTRASAAGLCIDPIGTNRVRTLFPFAQPTGIVTRISDVTCSADSGSVFCGLASGMNTLNSRYPGRVDHVLMPGNWDWTPKQWTRTTGANGMDSLWAIFSAVGLRGVTFNPTSLNSNVGLSWTGESGALPNYATAPNGWAPAEQRVPVRWGTVGLGYVNQLGARSEPSAPSWTWYWTHDLGSEYSRGSEMNDYYIVDAGAYYKHNFHTGTAVLALNAGELGARGDGYPQSPTWYAIKWLTHEWMAENSLGTRWPDGTKKILDEWDYAENLNP